jgi:hypothetical protein
MSNEATQYPDLGQDQYPDLGLLLGVQHSIRYHDRRRAFFGGWHHLTLLLAVLVSGAVVFGGGSFLLPVFAVLSALFAILDAVIGFSDLKNLHANLRRRFADLEIDMLRTDVTAEAVRGHKKARLAIEIEEPPVYRALDLLCRNDLLVSKGLTRREYPGDFTNLTAWQKWTCQFYRWDRLQADGSLDTAVQAG